jgi:riboflavin kinase / FMN adenylyltransferase
MEVYDDWRTVPAHAKGTTLALGAFDGLHLGHVAVLRAARAAKPDARLAVAAFEPPPKCYFAAPDAPSFRLNTRRLRAERAADVGAQIMFALGFDAAMAAMGAQDFVCDVLVGALQPCHITIGHDFRFGAGRSGDGAMLASLGNELGFGVTIVPPVLDHSGVRYSSTRVREAIKAGNLAMVTTLLGRPWRVEGVVVDGQKRGRTIGFPTANIYLEDQLAPRFGVYAVRVNVVGQKRWHSGVANFGRTPTTGLREPLMEINIFDFDGDIYGQRLEVGLHAFLRPEMKFDSFDALVAQISADAAEARTMLSVVA